MKAKGYSESGGSLTRRSLRSFIPSSGSPVDDIDSNNSTLRQRSRMLYMASPIATSAVNTTRTKVVGTGLVLKSVVDRDVLGLSPEAAKEWQRKAEAEFKLWAGKKQNCDALCVNSYAGLQQLVVKSWLMSGDVFVLIKHVEPTASNPYGLRLHVIEADRVCTPLEFGGWARVPGLQEGRIPDGKPGGGHRIFDGVEVDEGGHVVAYHVCSCHPYSVRIEEMKFTRVLAYGETTGAPNILHIMDCERPEQYRGVSYLAQVIEPLLQVRRYTESELMGALVQSFFTAWVSTAAPSSEFPLNEVGGGDVDYESDSGISEDDSEYEMGPGNVLHLKEGENVSFGEPKIPTAGFDSFLTAMCKLIGSALEIPYEILIKEFSSSYSASRGALLEAWEGFRMRREWLIEDLCQPVYELFISEAVARGRLKAPGFFDDPAIRAAWCGSRWIGPVQGTLDPVKEANAALLLVSNGIKTHEQVTRELGGGDWEENVEQLVKENALLAEAQALSNPVAYAPVERERPDEREEDEDAN